MPDIESVRKSMQQSESELRAINPELVRSIIELDFKSGYDEFLKDGKPRILYQGEFLGNTFPLYLIYQSENAQTLFSYEGIKTIFQNIFRNDVRGNMSDYPMYADETTLTEYPNMPGSLSSYVGKRVRTETISYLLRSRGDGKLRKIEYVRYLDLDDNSPIAEKWEGKSWEASGVSPSNGTYKKIPVFAALNRELTPISILV